MPEVDRATLALDKESVRSYDTNGHLHVAQVVISKAMISPYKGSEIPSYKELGLDPDRIYQLYRDPKELERAAHTFAGQPLLFTHKATSSKNHQQDIVIGAVMNPIWEDPYLKAELVVWPEYAVEAVETRDKRELSCGYAYVPVMTPGTFHNQPYDGLMTELKANHVAIVENGRVGPEAIIGDSNEEILKMTTAKDSEIKEEPKAKDAEEGGLKGFLKGKMSEDDYKTACDMMEPDEAEDLISEEKEEKGPKPQVGKDKGAKDKGAKDKAKDAEPEDKKDKDKAEDKSEDDEDDDKKKSAMDAAIDASVTAALSAERVRQFNLREAERFVRPLVGEIAIACDSAEAVYRQALKMKGVKADDIREVPALKRILELSVKQEIRRIEPTYAMDASSHDAAVKIAPGLGRIRIGE